MNNTHESHDQENILTTDISLPHQTLKWAVDLKYNAISDMCWGYSKSRPIGNRDVAYNMTTDLGPVRATCKKKTTDIFCLWLITTLFLSL